MIFRFPCHPSIGEDWNIRSVYLLTAVVLSI